ncbi:MAG TPA: 6,7-dimethyl-8-ribityllumazine synthase [Chitinophagaceae bacterium]|nr:6,7-dimethyl-8-ribityllumazine synthase [Chitinophagaceae bacterium]
MASIQSHNNLLQFDNLQIPNSQVVLIYTEWNEAIIQALCEGARKILSQFPQIEITEICVPGAVEIPFAINQHFLAKKASAYIALGCVIKGDTPHFDYVCDSVTQGVTLLNTQLSSPVIFGVLTVHTEQQAWDRLGGSHGHKGEEAAIAALKMMAFKESLT